MDHITKLWGSFTHGTTSYLFLFYVLINFLDLITGSYRAWKKHTVDSIITIRGVIEHILLVFVPMVLYPFADIIGYGMVADTVIISLLTTQVYSVVENWIACDLPFDKKWLPYLETKKKRTKKIPKSIHTNQNKHKTNKYNTY